VAHQAQIEVRAVEAVDPLADHERAALVTGVREEEHAVAGFVLGCEVGPRSCWSHVVIGVDGRHVDGGSGEAGVAEAVFCAVEAHVACVGQEDVAGVAVEVGFKFGEVLPEHVA